MTTNCLPDYGGFYAQAEALFLPGHPHSRAAGRIWY